MKRWISIAALALATAGCGGGDDDDVARAKTPMAMDQVPPAVLAAAKKAAPDLTFFSAARETSKGRELFELKGKTKSGKVKEIEVTPDGVVLGFD